jgi:molybdopterin molybdotransferase
MALMPVAEALQRVLADAKPLPTEVVSIDEAFGRILTEDVVPLRTQPVPVVNFIRLASAAESDDPLRDVGFLQNDLMGCRRSISAVGSTGS